MHRLILLALFLLFALPVQAQTTFCTETPAVSQVNPTRIYVQHADIDDTFPDGSDKVTSVRVGVFANGADPQTATPVLQVILPKAAFSAVATETDCFTALFTEPLAIPTAVNHIGATKIINAFGESLWSGASNPFFVAGAPSASSPPRVR